MYEKQINTFINIKYERLSHDKVITSVNGGNKTQGTDESGSSITRNK